jgi:multidrug efflux pump subunit AcrA (membrane-fusion protein)
MHRSRSVAVLALLMAGCSRSGPAKVAHEPPATVEHPRTEAELSTIKLTAEAVKRLGIETVTVRTDSATATRTLGGEIVVPEGRSVVVTAPVAGTLTGAAGPRPGTRVRRGNRLMTIAPLVPAERDQRIEAQRAVTAAEAVETAARQRLQRLEQLLKDGAASVRSVEEARAQHLVTVAELTAARGRLQGASNNPVGPQGELAVSAPFDGIVQRVSAVPGQTVAASAALLELAQIDTLWVRVAVYAGDVAAVDEAQPVAVRRLGAEGPIPATRVPAPLQGDPAAASVDLYYALSGAAHRLRPGERVLADLPLRSTE